MGKKIDSLVEDIYSIFTSDHKINEKNLEELGENFKSAVKKAINNANAKRIPTLRMSVIGKPDRQLYFELKNNNPNAVVEFDEEDIFEPNPEKFIKFLYGDLMEELLVFLIKEAGHSIKFQQEEVEIDDVLGHTDGVIDGVVSDMKTASNYSFNTKFKNKGLLRPGNENDPFGYKGQIAAYREVLSKKYPNEVEEDRVAWLALNKETGELTLLIADVMDLYNAEDRIKHLKFVLSQPNPPKEKCYSPIPKGKSGNEILSKGCTYCPFKKECWADANNGQGLLAFQYAKGYEYFTKLVKLPPAKIQPVDI